MQEIRAVLPKYDLRDIYNCDETAYYWRMQPDRGLSTQQFAGKKKDKTRISVMVTANGDRSEREHLWIIGTARNPRCFKNVDIDSLGCQFRWNNKAWTRTDTMADCLERFNRKMAHRKRRVVLLLDSFSAHQAAVAQLGGDEGLSNFHILWLPKNATLAFQPNYQGQRHVGYQPSPPSGGHQQCQSRSRSVHGPGQAHGHHLSHLLPPGPPTAPRCGATGGQDSAE